MPNIHLFFSHTLTPGQEEEIYTKLKCERIITLPDDLQQLWEQIPPEGDIDDVLLAPFIKYLTENIEIGDYVLVQGEFGVSFAIVNWCLNNNRIPIYATTKRVADEEKQPNGSVKKINIFKHVQFRRYAL
ncbi:MAG: CRISPR-associated protein Csx20 [Candidatus Cloacimonadales bacterium]|nr:CRISPR-associated protein Csx20 [Candidatus Cloacimonadales bacterium]